VKSIKSCGNRFKAAGFLTLTALFVLFALFSNEATCDNKIACEKYQGAWKFDYSKTLKLRLSEGIPWHIGDRYGMGGGGNVIREFDCNSYRFFDEKSKKLVDRGNIKIIESNKDEIVIRLFPADNRFDVNELKFDELMERFTNFPGENVPYLIGIKFVDDNTVESFSYVRGIGKSGMIKKSDRAFWLRNIDKEK